MLLLVEHLPEDSATHAAYRGGPEFRPWTTQAHLLTAAVNLLAGANYQRAGKRGRVLVKPPKKKQAPRRTVRVGRIGSRAADALRRIAAAA